ncbi:MAG: energy-coupling factor ABC transporter ATP-binding protein [Synergistaceae bacterium]|jgi:energy-coupling factor transport system ATP-binding protein|nr:energy-coupling factor ABC transporter ATP-binding protein [Synergistaceae bacterium]
MLRFENVFFYRESANTISEVSFDLREGEFAALIGENGAGKSTLCRLCNGLLKPASGRVTVCGHDTATVSTSRIARDTGFLFQNPDMQLCQNTVYGEIMFGLEYALSDPEERKRRTGEILELFSLDGGRDPFSMSRGERQHVALASILACKPRLLILDEPTTGLDYRECVTIMGIISRLHSDGTTILMVSHDMEVVADFAVRALVLSKGRLIADGPVRQIMKDKKVLDEASLLPPQIPALAMLIGGDFSDVLTADEMAETAERAVRQKGARK